MFDRTFWDVGLQVHVTAKAKFSSDGSTTVKVRLHTGEQVTVIKVIHVDDGYVVVEVAPRDGKFRKYPADERKQGAPPFDRDRIAIPCETIAQIEVTTAPQEIKTAGFQG